MFGKEKQKEMQKLLDKYLVLQINYRLVDFRKSSKAFTEIFDFVLTLDPKNDKQTENYESILDITNSSLENRKLVEAIVVQRMSRLEWMSLIALELLIAAIIVIFNDRSFFPSLISSLLVTSGFVLLIVLRRLDSLLLQENKWIWLPLHNLFITLDLLPYYPDLVITGPRAIKPPKGKIRICHNDMPYPDMTHNEIEIVEITGTGKIVHSNQTV